LCLISPLESPAAIAQKLTRSVGAIQTRKSHFKNLENGQPICDDCQARTGGFRAPTAGQKSRAKRLARGLMEQFAEFAWRELAAPAIRNANSVAGCFELAGFGDGDH
jgi:hypothetical protein